MQRRLDIDALVERRDGALLQVEPVVGADGQTQQPQAADGEDAAQQSQGPPTAGAHGRGGGESGGGGASGSVRNKKSPGLINLPAFCFTMSQCKTHSSFKGEHAIGLP